MKQYIDLTNLLPGVEFCLVEGGEFIMGCDSEQIASPAHPVSLSSFYMGKHPVAMCMWEKLMGPSITLFGNGPWMPMDFVSWPDAMTFVEKINNTQFLQVALRHAGLLGWRFDLPTEAEWEFAARGGNLSRGCLYSGSDDIEDVGWWDGNSLQEAQEIGRLEPNELGLHDMSGNVWEWCKDWHSDGYYAECLRQGMVLDPQGPAEGNEKIKKGGDCCSFDAKECSVWYRWANNPKSQGLSGVRLVLRKEKS